MEKGLILGGKRKMVALRKGHHNLVRIKKLFCPNNFFVYTSKMFDFKD